jgi:hypothetical protein
MSLALGHHARQRRDGKVRAENQPDNDDEDTQRDNH